MVVLSPTLKEVFRAEAVIPTIGTARTQVAVLVVSETDLAVMVILVREGVPGGTTKVAGVEFPLMVPGTTDPEEADQVTAGLYAPDTVADRLTVAPTRGLAVAGVRPTPTEEGAIVTDVSAVAPSRLVILI